MARKKAATKMTKASLQKLAIQANQIHQDKGDFLLPQIVDYIDHSKWIDPRPIYQRRLVWSLQDKSLFLESLFLNLPVPPLFLFEKKYGEWEIMDGQQRSTAIVEFYNGSLRLKGLERVFDLNGKTYPELPEIIQKAFDRRRIQVITILAGSEQFTDFNLRKEVFERLNTGGTPLNDQEIRNCIYAGDFCDLLDELASLPVFTTMWGIPDHKVPREMAELPSNLLENSLFKRMIDCELVLRFFALEDPQFIKSSIKKSMDACMEHYCHADKDVLESLKVKFASRIDFVNQVFGDDAILIPSGKSGKRPAKKVYDALMSVLGEYEKESAKLISRKKKLRLGLDQLISEDESYEVLITQHDSEDGFKARAKLIREMIDKVLK